MTRKPILLILAAFAALCLTGCPAQGAKPEADEAQSAETQAATESASADTESETPVAANHAESASADTESETPVAANHAESASAGAENETPVVKNHAEASMPADAETSAAAASVQQAAPVSDNQFVFTRSNFPRLDGSTPAIPLGQALASVLLGESREQAASLISFSKTSRSYRALMNGDADVILAAEPSHVIWAEKDDGGYDWDMAPFAIDALVFIVNASNPVDSLTGAQLRDIYAGRITNWSEVGGDDLEIIAFQRDEEAGSQTVMENRVMRDEPMAEAPTELVRGEMGDLVKAVAAFEDSPAAIGYTMYYYAHNMGAADGLKILSVNGVAPSLDAIWNSDYPFLSNYYVVTNAGRFEDDPAKLLYDWILSADGQRLIEHEGYMPITGRGGGAP